MDYQEMYEDLLYSYRQRGYRIEELEDENKTLQKKLNSAENKIEDELKPRIQSEKDSYDFDMINGRDECTKNGMAGNCGEGCTAYESKPECTN